MKYSRCTIVSAISRHECQFFPLNGIDSIFWTNMDVVVMTRPEAVVQKPTDFLSAEYAAIHLKSNRSTAPIRVGEDLEQVILPLQLQLRGTKPVYHHLKTP